MQNLERRVTELESLVMHLQRDYEQLNAVVLEQRGEIAELRAKSERLQHVLRRAVAGEDGAEDDT